MQHTTPRSVADIEGFVGLLQAACNDPEINATLERLLSMPDDRRRGLVHTWVSDLLIEEAPKDFIEAGRLPDGRRRRRKSLRGHLPPSSRRCFE